MLNALKICTYTDLCRGALRCYGNTASWCVKSIWVFVWFGKSSLFNALLFLDNGGCMNKKKKSKKIKKGKMSKLVAYLFFIFPSLAMANNIVSETINSVIKAVTDGPT